MTSEPVAAARALQPLVREAADEAERERRLPARVAEAMAKAGLYRVGAAKSFGGGQQDPATQIAVIEAISEADGSAGWNLMIGIESFGLLTLGFPRGAELFADPSIILAGSTAAVGRADAVEGGFRVSGHWQFASGVHNCHYFSALSAIHEDGEPRPGEFPRLMILPRSEIEIIDNWNVGGLRGSGSHDVRIEDAFVPEENVVGFLTDLQPLADAPIARFPRGSRLSYNKVGVALGIARASINDFVSIAKGKVPRFSSSRSARAGVGAACCRGGGGETSRALVRS